MRKVFIFLVAGFAISCAKPTKFELLDSKHTGIDFANTITETDSFHCLSYEYIYNGAGVGIGDLNNDGLQDIIFAGNQVSTRVYLNLGKFKFKDITENFTGLTNNQWYSGVTLVDINNDRLLDLYLTSTASTDPKKCRNRLWINNGDSDGGDPTYTEMAEKYGIASEKQSVNAAFFDYDRDGDLDLYVLNNTLTQRMNTSYRTKINDGSAQNNDELYRNNGDGTFTDVTVQAGIVYEGFGLGLAIGDVNKDSYPDIYVSNDYMSNDLLYINQGDGTFRNEIKKYMSYQTKSSMGNDMADINNDGYPDMFTLDMMPEYYYKIRQTINGFSYQFYINDYKFGYEHQYLRNMLHLHNGFINGEMLPYSEVGQLSGIYKSEWSWSPLFADYDNDGDRDLIIANGYPKDMTDKDWTRYKAELLGFLASEQDVINKAPAVKVPNFAFENNGDLHFTKKSHEWLGDVPSYSYGASFVDLDNDGDLDYVSNNIDDKAFIYKNNTVEKSENQANYFKVKLVGQKSNTMALGAKVELWSNGTYQFNEHFLTRGYASSVDPVVHFGLSGNSKIDSLRVIWPATGYVSVVKNSAANQTIEVNETTAVSVAANLKPDTERGLMFEKRANTLNYLHEQNDFVDFFFNQNIIPHKFSQIGPRMAKGDLNGDGLDDLIIGSTNMLPTKVFLRKGNAFLPADFDGLTTQKEFSESDLAIVDIDGDGDKDVIALAGGFENNDESEYRHYLYENNKGTFKRISLPVPPFPASVVRPFDFDHDGDMDLFLGSRVKRTMYPYATQSWLIVNENGRLTQPSAGINLGMVTDAIWSDYDGDGWEDLLVTREWNSIVIMKNRNGKALEPVTVPGMEDYHGIWYTLAAGDFDQDGDDDYIAGNLGENHRFTVSDQYPLQLYAIDLDLDGNLDPLSTGYWKDSTNVMKEYPINYLDELWAQSTFFQKLFKTYGSFSHVSMENILDEEILKRLDFKLHVNTTSSYILWNDNGSFRWEKLPLMLQFSPVKKMIVRDLNNDKLPDVIVGGNDYTYDVSTGYYDALKGAVLLNKGKQTFDLLTPSKSGLLLHGMIESLEYFEGDTLMIVAGFNRDNVAVFKQVRK